MRAIYGVEPFDVGYGAAFNVGQETPADVECPIVEDGGAFTVHTPGHAELPDRLAFVDGTMTTEARLTRIESDGTITPGLAGSWAAGAVLAEGGAGLRTDHITCDRMTVMCAGAPVPLPAQPAGWSWTPTAITGDMKDARDRLQRAMRDAEGVLGERLANDGWLTVIDGPLSNVRKSRTIPVVGYVKTHHRRMLEPTAWARVPELQRGQRSSMFAIDVETYAAYLRVGESGPWASPWAGIVRLEVPALAGEAAARDAIDRAAAWLPRYASRPHRDPRAPVNLTPISGLERQLRRRTGNPALALRATRAAVLQLNAAGASTP